MVNKLELYLNRQVRTGISTIGPLKVNTDFTCYILEDTDRGLTSTMTLEQIKKAKVWGRTCIPTGRYEIKKVYWPRRNEYYLQLQNVPGYSGIFIHEGNDADDTEGCLLPGLTKATDFVGKSRNALQLLESIVFPVLDNGGQVFINIT